MADQTGYTLTKLLDEAEKRLEETPSGAPDEAGLGDGLPSVAQEYLWSFHQINPNSPAHNRSSAYRFEVPLDRDRLRKSFRAILERHPELRSVFRMRGQGLERIDSGRTDIPLEVVDLRHTPGGPDFGDPSGRMRRFAGEPFDLKAGPLVRACAYETDRGFILQLVIHHIVVDAWSATLIASELHRLYTGFEHAANFSETDAESGAGADYSAFVTVQRRAIRDGSIDASVRRTLDRIRGAPTFLDLPLDRRRPEHPSGNAVTTSVTLPRDLLGRIESLATAQGATLHMVLSGIYSVLLYRYTGVADLLVGIPHAGRAGRQFDRTVGLFMNFLVQRARLAGNPSFLELMTRVREDALDMLSAADAPFELVARSSGVERKQGLPPLVQVLFNLENLQVEGLTPFEPIVIEPWFATHDLAVEAQRTGEGLRMDWIGNADIFDAGTIRRMAGHFTNLLNAALGDSATRIDELRMTTPDERARLLAMSTAPSFEYPSDTPVHELFESWVERHPDKTAIFDGNLEVSYRELDERANRMAHYLLDLGVSSGDLVPVVLERSVDLVVSWVAVVKAGAAFVGLDRFDPIGRLAGIVKDAQARIIITDGDVGRQLLEQSLDVVVVDPSAREIERYAKENPAREVRASGRFCVLFTSGSTGAPKGVISLHRSMTTLYFGLRHVSLDSDYVTLVASSPSFDAILTEIWGPLMFGGSMVIDRGRLPSARSIEGAVSRFGICDLFLTASVFEVVVDDSISSLRGVKSIRTGGEALSVAHAVRAARELDGTTVLNWYGPTESTIIGTSFRVPADFPDDARSIPIGKPVGGRHVYILDERLEPVPIGVSGEIFIGGDGLADGYLNRPELTAERFVSNPFREESGAKMYRTGDLGRFLPSGDIEFLGRLDRQFKLHGVRIEPGEIESVLADHADVQEAAVLIQEMQSQGRGQTESKGRSRGRSQVKSKRGVRSRPEGQSRGKTETKTPRKRLIAFYTLHDGVAAQPASLRRHLEERLSRHLAPAALVELDALPRLTSGKIDETALLQLAPEPSTVDVRVPPVGGTEQRLAAIWSKVLGVDEIGATDDFFAASGDSLQAVRLIVEIERSFDTEIPTSIIFEAPTIRQQAVLLHRNAEEDTPWSSLIRVKPTGSRVPFFCVPMASTSRFRPLADLLPDDQPFFGLQAPGLWKRDMRNSTIGEMAAAYHHEIKKCQPEGPYQLGGICIGSIVAFEIARMLRAEGEEVRSLVVLDTVRPPDIKDSSGKVLWSYSLRVAQRALEERPWSWRDPVRRFVRRRQRRWRHFRQRGWRVLKIQDVMFEARQRYLAMALDCPIDVLTAEKPENANDIQQHWRTASTRDVRFWPVRGCHTTMWDDPNIRSVAATLMEVIEYRS